MACGGVLPQATTEQMYETVLDRVSGSRIKADYIRSLHKFEVDGGEGYGVGLFPVQRHIPAEYRDRVVVIYRPRRIDKRFLPIYWRRWVLDEAPPPPPNSMIRFSIVSRGEAERLRQYNRRRKRELAGLMRRYGYDIQAHSGIGEGNFDLSFAAVRMEFGGRGFEYRPAWRPAWQKITASISDTLRQLIEKKAQKERARVETRGYKSLTAAEAKKFAKFTKMVIGVR